MSDIVIDIVSNITGFITYFAPGFIFVNCFYYASCLQRETEKDYLIIKSISISYLFYVLTSYMFSRFNLSILTIQAITFIEVVILGLMFGRIHRTDWANKLSLFLFKREFTNNMFVELWEISNNCSAVVCVTLTMKDNLGIYEGQIYKVFSYGSNQEILLSYYVCYDYNKHVISDYSSFENSYLLVHYSDIQAIEFEIIPTND